MIESMAITNLTFKVSLNTRTVELSLHEDNQENGSVAYIANWDENGHTSILPVMPIAKKMTGEFLGMLMDLADTCIDSEMLAHFDPEVSLERQQNIEIN